MIGITGKKMEKSGMYNPGHTILELYSVIF